MEPCPKCGGQRTTVETSLGFINRTERAEIYLRQPLRQASFFNPSENMSPIRIITCKECGYTEFFATDVNNLIPDDEM